MPEYLTIALDLIKTWEGWEEAPYQDPTGTWTIGYGFTQGVTKNTPKITQEQALAYLTSSLEKLASRLDVVVYEPLNNHQKGALLSFIWNVGMGTFERSSLLTCLNNGAYGEAATKFNLYHFSKGIPMKGLSNRRAAEMACFNTPDETSPQPPPPAAA